MASTEPGSLSAGGEEAHQDLRGSPTPAVVMQQAPDAAGDSGDFPDRVFPGFFRIHFCTSVQGTFLCMNSPILGMFCSRAHRSNDLLA